MDTPIDTLMDTNTRIREKENNIYKYIFHDFDRKIALFLHFSVFDTPPSTHPTNIRIRHQQQNTVNTKNKKENKKI